MISASKAEAIIRICSTKESRQRDERFVNWVVSRIARRKPW